MNRSTAILSLTDFIQQGNIYEDLSDYQIIDQFIVKGAANNKVILMSPLTTTKDHQIVFTTLTKESYVSQIKMKHVSGQDVLFTLIYGKYENLWKLNIIHIGDYSFNNHRAPYYYREAKEEFEKGNFINSYKYLEICRSILKPGGQVFFYDIEKDVMGLQAEITKKINENYSFPYLYKK